MAYTAWSVVYGEQPTAAKWNQLGANDAGFKDATNIDNLAILTRHLNTSSVTTPKLKPTMITYQAPTTGSYANSTTSWTDILSFNYTSGSTAERLFLVAGGLIRHDGGSSSVIRLNVNNVAGARLAYIDGSPARWENGRVVEEFVIPANTTVAIKLQGRCAGATGSTGLGVSYGGVSGGSDSWGPFVEGFALSNA